MGDVIQFPTQRAQQTDADLDALAERYGLPPWLARQADQLGLSPASAWQRIQEGRALLDDPDPTKGGA